MGVYKQVYNPLSGNFDLILDSSADIGAITGSIDAINSALDATNDNLVITDWRLQIAASLSVLKFVDALVDEFQDQSGIDLINSVNANYDAINKYYSGETIPAEDEKTVALIHFDSFPFVDERGHTINNSYVTLDMTSAKFGYSGAFPGQAIAMANSSDWTFGTADFTIDMWWKQTVGGGAQQLISNSAGLSLQYPSWVGQWLCNSFGWSAPWSGVIGTWYHIALVRYSGVTTLYIDGVPFASAPDTTNYNSTDLTFGALNQGNLDEIRVSKDVARWTSDFSASLPIQPYSTVAAGIENMTLISNEDEAVSQPTSARLVVLVDPVDAITLNTDLKAYVSENNGANYDEVTLIEEGYFDGVKKIFAGNVTLINRSDKTMRWKVQTFNTKDIQVHGVGMLWK